MTMPDRAPLPPLAASIKWGHREAPGSFLIRLLSANLIDTRDAARYVARLCTQAPSRPGYATCLRDAIAAELGGRSPDLVATIRARSQPIASAPYPTPRYGCTICSGGQRIRQVAHDAENVCLKHPDRMVWVGPGTTPETQRVFPYDPDSARAERRYRRHTATHRFNPDLTARAWEMVRDNARLSMWSSVHPVLSRLRLDDRPSWEIDARMALYPATVALAELLTDQRHLSIWLNPALSHRELREQFAMTLVDTGQYPCGIRDLVERMLVQLRPLRARAATWNRDPNWRNAPWLWEQDLSAVDSSGWRSDCQSSADPIDTGRCIDIAMYDLLPRKPLAIDEWDWQANGCASPWTAPPTLEAWYICQTCHNRYQTPTRQRVRFAGCRNCNSGDVIPGVNDLATRCPDIAAQWDPTPGANNLTPRQVRQYSTQEMGWLCPECGEHWRSAVRARSYGAKCKRCAIRSRHARDAARPEIQLGVNDLATMFPAIAAQWDHTPGVNGTTPQQVLPSSSQRISWVCPTCTAGWTAPVSRRVAGFGCPVCAGKEVLAGYNDLATLRPDLALEWDDTPGANIKTSQEVTVGSGYVAAWVCRVCGARWDAKVHKRTRTSGCPCCAGVQIWAGHNDLEKQRPDLAAEWDASPARNARNPDEVSVRSRYRAGWCCRTCQHRWIAGVCERTRPDATGCPACARRRDRPVERGEQTTATFRRWLTEP